MFPVPSRLISILVVLVCGLALHVPCSRAAAPDPTPFEKQITIMPLGDSITEGGSTFSCYRYPLWEKLFAGGYLIEYVGSRTGQTRIGPLQHEGYGGKSTEYLAANIERLYKAHPADIVLLHSGHNHSVEEKPVAGILASTEKIITTIHSIRPDATVLVAQVINSGKLPKYSYHAELNQGLATLIARLKQAGHRVELVNQSEGFDWHTDTIADHVHPNARGAEKMASKWYDALVKVLPPPKQSFHPELITYKKVKECDLKLHVFRPDASKFQGSRPALVFFFGGGWTNGTPLQFYRECAWLASRGMVAISADYRIASVNHSTPFESLEDAKSAIRWVRQHAAELSVDPHRIAASGCSAGGHLAAAAALTQGFENPNENLQISSRPDALVLNYPVIDNGPTGYGYDRVKAQYAAFSPMHAMDKMQGALPPTLFLLGTQDKLIPVATAEAFKKKIEAAGGRCDLHLYEGRPHPIFEYRKGESPLSRDVLKKTADFLVSIQYLDADKLEADKK